MKICPKCGKENHNEAKFCAGCAFDIMHVEPEEVRIKHEKRRKKIKIIGLSIIIIILLIVGLYVMFNQNTNQVISDLDGSDENTVDEQIISHEVNTDDVEFKTVDFNGLFKMDVWEESDFNAYDTYHNSTYDWIQINSEPSGNVEYVYYWEDSSISDAVSNLKDTYSNYQIEGDYVILSTDYVSGNNQYCVGVQSADNEVVFIEGADLDVLKTYADSIVFV